MIPKNSHWPSWPLQGSDLPENWQLQYWQPTEQYSIGFEAIQTFYIFCYFTYFVFFAFLQSHFMVKCQEES